MPVDKENIVESKFELDTDQFKQAIRDVMQEVNEAEKGTKKVNKAIGDGAEEASKKMTGSFKGAYEKIQKGFFEAFLVQMMFKQIQGLITGMSNLAKEADKFKISMIGLNSIANTFGQDGGVAQKMAQQLVDMSGGMVNLQQSSQGLKALISSGFNLEEAFNVSKSMLEIGAFNNIVGDLGVAFVDATKGIKTGSIELTENIGLTQRFSSIMKQAGVSIENGIDITNNAAQRQAFYNSIMKQGAGFVGDLAKVQKEYTGQLAKSQLEMKEFAVNLGKTLQPALLAGAKVISYFSGLFSQMFKKDEENPADKLFDLVEQMKSLQAITTPTKDEQQKLVDVMNQISTIAPNAVTAYDDMGNAQINFAEATKVVIGMKKLELIQTNKQLEADIKLNEQTKKTIESKKKKEGYWALATVSPDVLESVEFDVWRSNLAKELGKQKKDLTLETMVQYANYRKTKIQDVNGLQIDLARELEKAYSMEQEKTRMWNAELKELDQQITIQKEVVKANKEIVGLDEEASYQAFLAKRVKTTVTKTTQPDNKPKYDAKEASQDFLQTQTLDYEKSLKEFAVKRKEAKDQFDLDMIAYEEQSAKKIFEAAQKTAGEISKSESAKITDDIKFKFEQKKIDIEKAKELANVDIKNMQDNAEKTKKTQEEIDEDIKKINKDAQEDIVKQQGELNEITLDAMRVANADQTQLEKELAYEKLALKQAIADEEIRLNKEILDAKTVEEKKALQDSFENKMNDFKLNAGKESQDKQDILDKGIAVEKEHLEAIKEVDKLLEDVRNGENENWAENLEKIKGLTEQEKQTYEVSLVNAQDYATKKQIINDMRINIEDTMKNSIESIYAKIINGEKLSWTIMREMLKQNLRDRLLIDGQELAGTAIVETVKGVVASAGGRHISATAHYHAAATAAAGALAMGVAASAIKVSPTNTEETKKTTGTGGTDTGGSTTAPKEEEKKEIHIHNTSLRNVAITLIPELEDLINKGYSKIVLQED